MLQAIFVSLVLILQACAPLPSARLTDRAAQQPSSNYGNLPLAFEANHGQIEASVRFVAHGRGYSLFLTDTEAVLALRPLSSRSATLPSVVRMRLVGASGAARISGLDRLPTVSNYFIGNNPTRWQRDVPNYGKVRYAGVYPGIDQVFYGNQRHVEYDLVVAAHADPRPIALAFDGVASMSLDDEGNLVLRTEHGEIKQHKPEIYQDIEGRRESVAGHYVLLATNRVGLNIGSYDTTHALTIDPVLTYSTYFGGNSNDIGHAIAVDSSGNAYITGETLSTNFPGASGSPIQPTKAASYDVFVSKLNSNGSALIYSTYLGGSGGDYGYAIAIDDLGNAYVTGESDSPTTAGAGNVPFPTVGAVQPLYRGGGDAFVTKINAAGNALVYSTYLGGSGVERGYGIAVDSGGNAYVTGHTNSVNGPGNFPTAAPFQSQNGSLGSFDAFVTKLNAAGSALIYSTYLGGNASEYSLDGGAIAVDGNGNAFVGGTTASTNFPGAGASTIQAGNGGGFNDGFVVKFNPSGSGLIYSTYLGGSGYDAVNGLAIDAGADAYVVGYSDSPNFPVVAAIQPARNGPGNDAVAARINASGTALVYSTYLGGSGGDIAYHVAVDSGGSAFIAGWTNSSNFPTLEPLQAINRGAGDAFLAVLTGGGNSFLYSSYFGGSNGAEHAYGVALGPGGNAYITGETNSTNLPIVSPMQATLGGAGTDAFVARVLTRSLILEPPTGLSASTAGNTVMLVWNAPTDSITPTGYVLEGGVSPGEVLASLPTGSTVTAFSLSAPTGAFYLRMHSVSGSTRSVASNEIRVLVNVPSPPSAPANLLGSATGSTLALSWVNTAAGGIPTSLQLDVTGAFNGALGLPVTETFSFNGIPAGSYTFSLRASNSSGTSPSSNSVTLTFPGQCIPPGTPTAFVVSTSGNLISASWNAAASGGVPTGYIMNVTGAFTGTLAVQGRSVSGAVGSGSYTLSVAATNACGSSAATAAQTVIVP